MTLEFEKVVEEDREYAVRITLGGSVKGRDIRAYY
jgi:hypothetical protein